MHSENQILWYPGSGIKVYLGWWWWITDKLYWQSNFSGVGSFCVYFHFNPIVAAPKVLIGLSNQRGNFGSPGEKIYTSQKVLIAQNSGSELGLLESL